MKINAFSGSIENCAAYCGNQTKLYMNYFSLEYSDECWCGTALNDTGKYWPSRCSLPCGITTLGGTTMGATTEACGGKSYGRVYARTSAASCQVNPITSSTKTTSVFSPTTSSTLSSSPPTLSSSSSYESSSLASATVPAPAVASLPCPAALAQIYTSPVGMQDWQLFCLADFYFYDLPAVTTDTFSGCMDACDAATVSAGYTQDCVGVTWTGNDGYGSNCLLKYSISQVVYGTNESCSAKRVSYSPPQKLAVSVVPTYAAAVALPTSTTSIAYTVGPSQTAQPFQAQACTVSSKCCSSQVKPD